MGESSTQAIARGLGGHLHDAGCTIDLEATRARAVRLPRRHLQRAGGVGRKEQSGMALAPAEPESAPSSAPSASTRILLEQRSTSPSAHAMASCWTQ